MEFRMRQTLNSRTVTIEEIYRFFGFLAMSKIICCLCCKHGTGGYLFCL